MTSEIRYSTILIFAALAALLSTPVAAQSSTGSAHFGVVWGLSVPDADNTTPQQIYGVKGAAKLNPSISLGGYYLLSGPPEGSDGIDFEYSLHGLETSYHFPSGNGDTFVSLRYGLTKVKTEKLTENVIFSPYHYGISVGHDFFIGNYFSFGFEGAALTVNESSTTKDSVDYTEDSLTIIMFMLNFQVRL